MLYMSSRVQTCSSWVIVAANGEYDGTCKRLTGPSLSQTPLEYSCLSTPAYAPRSEIYYGNGQTAVLCRYERSVAEALTRPAQLIDILGSIPPQDRVHGRMISDLTDGNRHDYICTLSSQILEGGMA